MLATPPLFLEYEAVLKRPEQLAAPALSQTDLDAVLGALAALIEPVEAHLSWRPQLDDPDDETVLEAAINGRADALVTYDVIYFSGVCTSLRRALARPVGELVKAMGMEVISKSQVSRLCAPTGRATRPAPITTRRRARPARMVDPTLYLHLLTDSPRKRRQC